MKNLFFIMVLVSMLITAGVLVEIKSLLIPRLHTI